MAGLRDKARAWLEERRAGASAPPPAHPSGGNIKPFNYADYEQGKRLYVYRDERWRPAVFSQVLPSFGGQTRYVVVESETEAVVVCAASDLGIGADE